MLSNEEVRMRFRKEAATLAQIEHENIVRIFDYIESEHHQPCVMHTVGWLVKRDDAGITVACEPAQSPGN
jgi:hypothetical protein